MVRYLIEMSLDFNDLLADTFYLWPCIFSFCFFLLELEANSFSKDLLSQYLFPLSHIRLFDKTIELYVGKGFCQPVYHHLRDWNVLEVDLPSSYFIINVMMLNINVFCLSIIERVVGKNDRSLIVTFERDRDVC